MDSMNDTANAADNGSKPEDRSQHYGTFPDQNEFTMQFYRGVKCRTIQQRAHFGW
jgi:hypothetical protein